MRDFIPGQSAIYPDQAAALNDLLRRFGTDKGQVQPGTEGPQEYITAKITGTTTGGYAWTEQIPDPTDGTLSDKPGGMSNTTLGPAVELNGSVPASYPYYCELYFRSVSQDGPVYVFEVTGSGVSIPDAAYNVAGKINTSNQFFGLGQKYFDKIIGLTNASSIATRGVKSGFIVDTGTGGLSFTYNAVGEPSDPTATNANAKLYVGSLEARSGTATNTIGPASVTLADGSTLFAITATSTGWNLLGNSHGLTYTTSSGTLAIGATVVTINGTSKATYGSSGGYSEIIAGSGAFPGDTTVGNLNFYIQTGIRINGNNAYSGTSGGFTFVHGICTAGGSGGGMSIGGTITGASVPGGVLFQNSSGDLAQSSGITFNDTGDQLTLGVANSGTGIARFNQTDAPDTDSMPVGMTFGLFGASF